MTADEDRILGVLVAARAALPASAIASRATMPRAKVERLTAKLTAAGILRESMNLKGPVWSASAKGEHRNASRESAANSAAARRAAENARVAALGQRDRVERYVAAQPATAAKIAAELSMPVADVKVFLERLADLGLAERTGNTWRRSTRAQRRGRLRVQRAYR